MNQRMAEFMKKMRGDFFRPHVLFIGRDSPGCLFNKKQKNSKKTHTKYGEWRGRKANEKDNGERDKECARGERAGGGGEGGGGRGDFPCTPFTLCATLLTRTNSESTNVVELQQSRTEFWTTVQTKLLCKSGAPRDLHV